MRTSILSQAELYKEDFESERRDRKKAHDLKEEMRIACDQKVHAMEETIKLLAKRLEESGNMQQDDLAIKLVKSNNELKQLQNELFEARLKAITAQEEVQAKTVQVKQYKMRLDKEEEKVWQLLYIVDITITNDDNFCISTGHSTGDLEQRTGSRNGES